MENNILYNGYPSMEEIRRANGYPSEERFAKGPVAVTECVQEIPCNPCGIQTDLRPASAPSRR